MADNGLCCIEEYPTLRTNIRTNVADLDVAGSYPNGVIVLNMSKATTTKELFRVEGVGEYTQRMQGLNLSAGNVNAVEYCTLMFKMPPMDVMLAAYRSNSYTT